MPKFRKKPVEIEAVQLHLNRESIREVLEFLGQEVDDEEYGSIRSGIFSYYCAEVMTAGEMKISTLEGVMTAKEGDWIIRGVNGEFYPCKPDIFEKTYETV